MGRFYQLPTFGISGATDANQIDFQMGAEMIYSMMTAIYGRQNFVHDNGYMGIGQMGCLQSILAANELLTFAKRYAQDIEITEESIGYDLIKKNRYRRQLSADKGNREKVQKGILFTRISQPQKKCGVDCRRLSEYS